MEIAIANTAILATIFQTRNGGQGRNNYDEH